MEAECLGALRPLGVNGKPATECLGQALVHQGWAARDKQEFFSRTGVHVSFPAPAREPDPANKHRCPGTPGSQVNVGNFESEDALYTWDLLVPKRCCSPELHMCGRLAFYLDVRWEVALATVIPGPACGVHAGPLGEGLGWHVGSFLGSRMASAPEEAPVPSPEGFREDPECSSCSGLAVQDASGWAQVREPHGLRAI